jgi:uncharacterized membrane protein YbhN (UPF0104 family)
MFGLEAAMLSLLAGDVFRSSTVHARLLVFKLIYYISSALTPRATFESWLKQRRNLQAG